MSEPPRSFWSELKRRRVWRVAAGYGAFALATALAVAELYDDVGLPEGTPRFVIIVLALGFPVALGLAWVYEVRREEPAANGGPSDAEILAPSVGDPKSVAVLPLQNIGGDPENEFFSDGLTEDLIAHLSQVPELRVISRTSVMRFKHSKQDIREIASLLNVGSILEGSVRRASSRLRVVAQLIDARTDQHLWAETYDRDLEDVFEVQSAIALHVAGALQASLTPERERRMQHAPTESIDAHDAFLLGRHHVMSLTGDGIRKAEGYLRRAVELDPEHAAAHAGLAHWYLWAGGAAFAEMPAAQAIPLAKQEAELAIALDPDLGDAYATLTWIEAGFLWNWGPAERAARLGVERSPSSAWAWYQYANLMCVLRREEECLAAVRRVLELDPLAPTSYVSAAFSHSIFGHLDEALQYAERHEELDPGIMGPLQKTLVLQRMGDHDGAMDVLDGIDRHWGEVRGSAGAWLLAYTLGKAGRRAEFDQLVSVLERRVEEGTAGWTELALSFMGIGDHARALDYFERAPDQRPPGSDQSSYANIFPHFDPIRDDPRFQEVMRRIGPPEAASAPL